MVAANATQTIMAPNAAVASYNLAAGANSVQITPATNKPVLVMGSCTTTPFQGVGQVSLQHIPSFVIQWVGLESVSGTPPAITQGSTNVAGTHILYIDFSHEVAIQVASADTIRVHNGSAGTRAANVTLIW
jgi:hypothetical protein